ncbi:MFS transporter [Limosilactobacillus fermentum]|uniref:MFS transporter n=1 Tax=Limosilactobacillus fermentum TaxID=1613 RepID=UPI0021BE86C5|nr:MFS transporter [Limosilactobacillus fermentum]
MKDQRIARSLVIMVFGTFFGLLCSTLMNTGLPQLMRVFSVSEGTVQWIINAYMLTNAMMIPLSAYLIRRWSFRTLFIIATAVFLVGTVGGAVAPTFWTVVIARVVQAAGAGIMMPRIPHNENPHFDTRGMAIVSIGLWALLMGLSNVSTSPFWTWQVLGLLVVGAVALVIFYFSQRGVKAPLINFSVMAYDQFVVATLINMLIVATMFGNTILLPLLVQNVQQKSALVSGLVILPGALVTGFLSRLSGRLYDRLSVRRLVLFGLVVDGAGTLFQATIGAASGPVVLALFQAVRQLGLVSMLIPLQTHALGILPFDLVPDGVATFNTIRQVAASLGTAVLVSVVGLMGQWGHRGTLFGIQAGFATCFIFLVAAMMIAGRLKNQFKLGRPTVSAG